MTILRLIILFIMVICIKLTGEQLEAKPSTGVNQTNSINRE